MPGKTALTFRAVQKIERRKERKGDVLILPIFSDHEATVTAKILEWPQLRSRLIELRNSGSFRGHRGELWNQTEEGVLLVGLGKKKYFHPDLIGSVFIRLGAALMRFRDLSFTIVISPVLQKAVEEWNQIVELDAIPDLPENPRRGGIRDRENVEEEEAPPDFLAPLDLEELVAQSVCSLIVGSDPMDLLKKGREKRTVKIGAIAFYVPMLKITRLRAALKQGEILGRMVNGVRQTTSLPGNHFNPSIFERYSRSLAREYNFKIEVLNQKRLEREGFAGVLAVGRSSPIPPRVIVLRHTPEKKKRRGRIVLVGKGITFDTGGLSLKPAARMHEMKYDMAGAALVLHALALVAARKMPLEVIGILGVAENMPDGSALKPGDVYRAYNGLTVEVQNTDAEGRLLLADLLAYGARKYKPEMMLDFATLTGSCVIALGHEAAGMMTGSEDLARRLDRAQKRSLDRCWRLPHWRNFDAGLKSEIADLRNIGERAGGTISAMRFLSHFVPRNIPWAHFDIAGAARREKSFGTQVRGATGWGIRLLNHFFEDLIGS